MKGFFRSLILTVTATLLLTGCNRHKDKPNPDMEGARVQPGAPVGESEDAGYLAVEITKVYANQKALDQSPWHADGGEWAFFDCRMSKEPSIIFLVGTLTKSSEKNASDPIPVDFGEARLIASDDDAGAKFVDAFAKAFHTQSPPTRNNNPTRLLKMTTAVLGSGLKRDAAGGFKDGRGGTWTPTKWFLQDDPWEAEVFFNFSLTEKHAEFSEKDPDYRGDLIQQLAIALRDGPLPERTPENDPTLTLVGPTVVNWTPFGNSNEVCQFSPDGATVVTTASERGMHSKVFIAPTAHITSRKSLGEFEGGVSVQQFLPERNGVILFVTETLHKNPHMFSSSDPQRFWLLDDQGKHPINVPANGTNWIASKKSVSPDANFVALHSWVAGPDKQRRRVIQLGNLHTGEWRKVEMPGTELELVGWSDTYGVVLTGNDFEKNQVRKAYMLDTGTAKLSPLDSIPPKFDPAFQLSTDGKHSVQVIEKDRLIITEIASGDKREFVFHPYDKANVYRDSVHWANDRYLVFEGSRTALIDSQTLKMNFLADKNADVNSIEFSPDFKSAIGTKAGTPHLGMVKMPQ
jgi:hypothetical protein